MDQRSPSVSEPLHEEVATDPVCGMKVAPGGNVPSAVYAGRLYYFCSARCREKFLADSAKYVKPQTAPTAAATGVIYTCPMHPQIRQNKPGNCPICGMALEPLTAAEETGPSPELSDMTRRFWIGALLSLPVVVLEMGAHFPGLNLHHYVSPGLSQLVQFALASPVVLWAGWPFFERGWASVRNR